jgi:hypothetical protein
MKKLIFVVFFLISISTYAETNIVNLADHAKYTVKPAPSYRLTTDIGDRSQLTDSKYVKSHFWTSKESVGWTKTGVIKIEIDLGANRAVHKVCVNTARGIVSGVSFPESVKLFLSDDNKNFSFYGDIYQDQDHKQGAYLVRKFCSPTNPSNGRYLMVAAQPKGDYVFMDEIEVWGAPIVQTNTSPNSVLSKLDIDSMLLTTKTNEHLSLALLNVIESFNKSITQSNITDEINTVTDRLNNRNNLTNQINNQAMDMLFGINRQLIAQVSSQPLIIWHQNPWTRFTPFDRPMQNTGTVPNIYFNLMRNGTDENAFVVTNNTDTSQTLTIQKATQSFNTNNFPEISLFEVMPVITSPYNQFVGDALKPLVESLIIKPGESKQIWITAKAAESNAGAYEQKILINSNSGQFNEIIVNVNMKVWNVAFPASQQLKVNTWAYFDRRPLDKLSLIATKDLESHHVNLATIPAYSLPWPKFNGALMSKIDFTAFDKQLGLQKNSKHLFYLGFNDIALRDLNSPYKFMTPQWQQAFKFCIGTWVDHLAQLGYNSQDYAFYPIDEPNGAEQIDVLVKVSKLIKDVDPNLQIYTTLGYPVGNSDLLKISAAIDIAQVENSTISKAQKLALLNRNKEVWSYTALQAGKHANPFTFYRAQAWQAFSERLTGIGFWSYADIGTTGTAWNDFDGARADFAVVYETADDLWGSKRWKAWRMGVEDFELLRIATNNQTSYTATTEIQNIIDSALNIQQNEGFEVIRVRLLEMASGT